MQNIEATLPLVALKAISNGALASEHLPTRIKLLNWGRNDSTVGPVLVDERTVTAMAASQASAGFDRVALDYEHNTAEGSPEYLRTKEPRDVAGYGTPEVVPNDGLYLSAITWTESGKANAKNYADLSPTPRLDKEGRVTFLHSVALVRNGAVHGLSFFSAPAAKPDPKPTHTPMTPEQIAAAIAAALKPVTDTLTTLTADVKAIKETKPAAPVFEHKDGDKTITLSAADVVKELVALRATVAAQSTAADTAAKAEVIARFAADGKVPNGEDGKPMSDDALKALPLGVLKMLHASTPATVPLTARGKKPTEGQKATDGLTGLARAIAANNAERAAAA